MNTSRAAQVRMLPRCIHKSHMVTWLKWLPRSACQLFKCFCRELSFVDVRWDVTVPRTGLDCWSAPPAGGLNLQSGLAFLGHPGILCVCTPYTVTVQQGFHHLRSYPCRPDWHVPRSRIICQLELDPGMPLGLMLQTNTTSLHPFLEYSLLCKWGEMWPWS